MKIKLTNSYFVFDLDDTIYKEVDYKISGINHLVKKISLIYGVNLKSSSFYNRKDFIKAIQNKLELPDDVAKSFLWEYRLHNPTISLDKNTKDTLSYIKKNSSGVAIITDGRSITQRKKIKALGLEDIPLYISDEYGSEKPDSKRFKIIESKDLSLNYFYVGDNITKDFITPNKMGWTTIGLKDDGSNIHPQIISDSSKEYLPNFWINNIIDLKDTFE
jgi:putative hydrolase of the HAD superfamily|tara:strand:- start:1158 stop:1811 length:654 start_codon:yes stop_codon:yes gene_type:complete